MYSELQASIKTFLVDQLTYTLPQRAPSIFAEAPPDTPAAAKAAGEEVGLYIVVGKPFQKPLGGRQVEVSTPISVIENHEINFSDAGCNIEPEDLVADATSALDGYVADTFWTPISALPFDQLPPEQGLVGWGVLARTKTLIVRGFAALVDHNGKFLIEHNGKAFLTTNRGR